jgi:hypothetical protein
MMWIWWRLCGERPLPGVYGVLVGQPVRLRGQKVIAVVTRITADGVTWGRRSRTHEAAAAALERAAEAISASLSRDDEAALIATLAQQFRLSEGRAAEVIASARRVQRERSS